MSGAVFVCAAVWNTAAAHVAPGSTMDRCSICVAELWVAPSAKGALANHPNARKVCLECAVENGYFKKSRLAPMTDEQAKEIELMHRTMG